MNFLLNIKYPLLNNKKILMGIYNYYNGDFDKINDLNLSINKLNFSLYILLISLIYLFFIYIFVHSFLLSINTHQTFIYGSIFTIFYLFFIKFVIKKTKQILFKKIINQNWKNHFPYFNEEKYKIIAFNKMKELLKNNVPFTKWNYNVINSFNE